MRVDRRRTLSMMDAVKRTLRRQVGPCTLAISMFALGALPAVAGETPPQRSTKTTSAVKAKRPRAKPVKLHGTTWQRGLDATLAAARKANKPAFLVRMLGELDGKT
jgi:hypothetical protein